ncbi:MAG: YeeE/YedE family protein [Gammaproteobacteria bacterium]|nr:MAG: YeeE/YedE family protein [Gammaproteobacteria bacterium]
MNLDLYTQALIWFFILSVILGAIANKANFCTMGAVSDWVNMGDLNRLRSWLLSIAIAVIGVGILEFSDLIDMTLTSSNDTSNPPYRTPTFVWLRNIVGGVMFGVGMTLSSGCGNKTLVRLGEGNLKSLVVLIIMALAAALMLFSSFDFWVFLQWMTPVSIDFTELDISSQDLGSVLAGMTGVEPGPLSLLIPALLLGGVILAWVLRSSDFRSNRELLLAGFIIGAIVVIGWYITAGPMGIELLEELEFMDERPYAAGAQSFSFIAPTAHTAQYIYQGFSPVFLSIGVVTLLGVILGSFLYTIIFRTVRIEWFANWMDFLMHAIGAVLMGIGGVLAMGCTIGQGISGVSTMALGSILTLVSIIGGSAATMKYQYYLMMRE